MYTAEEDVESVYLDGVDLDSVEYSLDYDSAYVSRSPVSYLGLDMNKSAAEFDGLLTDFSGRHGRKQLS
jgi:hypothetical protein